MRSVNSGPPEERTAEARIKHAALELFGELGPDKASIRLIAQRAGVSAPLVIHHFDSKAGLLTAVDDYLLGQVSLLLNEFAEQTNSEQAAPVIAAIAEQPELIQYMARALTSNNEAGSALFDQMLDITLEVFESMQKAGTMRPAEDPTATALLLIASDLGMMLLRGHLERVLGTDPYSSEGLTRMTNANLEMMTDPLITYPTEGP